MKTLLEITDADFGLEPEFSDLPLRIAARAVIINGEKVALQYISRDDFYKLPGGALEDEDEGNWEHAAERESLEETGYIVKMRAPIGAIVEHRGRHQSSQWNPQGLKQISYCGIADFIEDTGALHLDAAEVEEGLTMMWVTLDEAIELSRRSNIDKYNAKFIQKRDTVFLEEARRILGK